MTVEAKHAAAEAAAGANDVAAGLAVAAGVAAGFAWAAGVGAGVAAVLAVGSGFAWLIGNEYGDLALDPPRDDYHLVARFTPRNVELPPGESEIEAIWNEFNRTQIEIADAISALIRSFERLEGARLDLRKPGADVDLLARRITTQRQAIRHNAAAGQRRIRLLLKLQSRVNAAWRANVEVLRANAEVISGEERQQIVKTLWGKVMPTLQHTLGDHVRLDKMQSFIENAALTSFEVPDSLLNTRWNRAMVNMEKRLAVFAGERTLNPLRHELDRRA